MSYKKRIGTTILAAALTILLMPTMLGRAHAAPASGVNVFVGYADNLRANATHFPTPWDGSPGVIYQGCLSASCSYDAGAVRVENDSNVQVTIDSVVLHFDTCAFDIWPHGVALPPGGQLILTQTASGAGNGCSSQTGSAPTTMDSSDFGPGGQPWSGQCMNSNVIPQVDVSIDGVVSTFADNGQVLNTGGVDQASCGPVGPGNESTQWTSIGNNPCPGAVLTLAPPSQTHDVNTPATVQATLANSCGTPLSNVTVNFQAVSGPDAGVSGSAATDSNGNAPFKYNYAGPTNAVPGPDTLQATVTNPAGTIDSNNVTVNWTIPALNVSAGGPYQGPEGNSIAIQGSATDPLGQPVTTQWSYTPGPGTTGTCSFADATALNTSVTCTEEGTYTLSLAASGTFGRSQTATTQLTVSDAALAAQPACPATSSLSFNGLTASFTDAASPNGTLSDFSATINWGDGSSSTGTASGPDGGPYAVSGSHTYASTGYRTITTMIKDVGGSAASTSCTTLVFAYAPGGGSFVIGDLNSAVGTNVTFWGAQWAKANSLSGGAAPNAFKGFADTLSTTPPAQGGTWTTDPGNSSGPPSSVPSYMAVIVSSKITQAGSLISGNIPHIVIVKTNAGYAPSPGHAGTGTVVAQVS